jgi:murein DD-endopeptidase MepM/ murein hydrolase activator NlpD
MKILFSIVLVFLITSCGTQYHFASRKDKGNDTSFVYSLPYPKGTSHFMVQGYNSKLSHQNRLALDFKMKKGSPVTAARDGVVVRVQEGFTKGGISKKYLGKANQVVIRHSDGSQAMYAHLQHNGALVNVGDTVKQGDTIAKSGSTGYSAMPHLHFIVWGPTVSGRSQLPTRFNTKKGVEYLKPGKWYKAF